MITAVDTNILVDVINGSSGFAAKAIAALRQARIQGVIVICDVVYAETCAAFSAKEHCDEFLESLDIKIESLEHASSFGASRAWIEYLRSGGKRLRVLPDFLIAAHAEKQADQLLTRDRGFFKSHFPKLHVVDPAKP